MTAGLRWLRTVGLAVWATATVSAQTAAVVALSPELRRHVVAGRFDVVSSLNGLPAGVRAELRTLFNSKTLDIHDAGTTPRATAQSVGAELRTLIAAGCSREDCLLYYELAGPTPQWRVVLIHWTPEVTTLEWGGAAPAGLSTVNEVRSALLSGRITGSAGPW
jgi:hypothetical protein